MTADAVNTAATPAPHGKSLDCRARFAAWRDAAAWVVVSVWLASTGYAFWSFELGQQRSFESPRTVLFDSGNRARSAEAWFRVSIAPLTNGGAPAAATVVHVYTAGCVCNRFTHPHLARIVTRYRSAGVNFFAAERPACGRRRGDGHASAGPAAHRLAHRKRVVLDRCNSSSTRVRRAG